MKETGNILSPSTLLDSSHTRDATKMKTTICSLLLFGIALGLIAGCNTPEGERRTQDRLNANSTSTSSQANGEASRPPVEPSPELKQDMESVVRLVLDAHRFVPPVFLQGQDGIRWVVSTRPGSERELVLALVKMGPGNQSSVELFLYAHIGSAWAPLGKEFSGWADQEAREMNDQIRERVAK